MRCSLVFLLGIVGCTAHPPTPIALGHVAPQATAEAEARGIRLALADVKDELSAALEGRPVLVRHTDTRGEEAAYGSEAVRLTTINRALGLIGGRSAEQVQALDRAGTPLVTFLGHAPAGLGPATVHVGLSPAARGKALGTFAAEQLKAKRPVLVVAASPLSQHAAEAFRGLLQPTTIRYGDAPKWDDIANEVRQARPDALAFVGPASDFEALRAKLDAELPLLYAGAEAVRPGNVVVATAFDANDRAAPVRAFAQRYREAFRAEPDESALLGYDAMRLLAEALKKAGPTPTLETVRAALVDLKDVPGATGSLTVGPDRVVQRRAYAVKK